MFASVQLSTPDVERTTERADRWLGRVANCRQLPGNLGNMNGMIRWTENQFNRPDEPEQTITGHVVKRFRIHG